MADARSWTLGKELDENDFTVQIRHPWHHIDIRPCVVRQNVSTPLSGTIRNSNVDIYFINLIRNSTWTRILRSSTSLSDYPMHMKILIYLKWGLYRAVSSDISTLFESKRISDSVFDKGTCHWIQKKTQSRRVWRLSGFIYACLGQRHSAPLCADASSLIVL